MPPSRRDKKHRKRKKKMLFALAFAALAIFGITLMAIHKLKQPVGAPSSPITPVSIG